jgi:hypothetical protein
LNGGIAYATAGVIPFERGVCVTKGSLSQACSVAIWHAVNGVIPAGGMTPHFEHEGGSGWAMTAITIWNRYGVGVSGQDEA